MANESFISVIIPTYNRADMLRSTLTTLAEQSLPPNTFEVVVVDDGSSDSTQSITQDTYPYQLRVIRQENQGSTTARNRGAAESRGDLLVFLDDDMLLEKDYLAGLSEIHQHAPQVVGMGTSLPYMTDVASLYEKVTYPDRVAELTVDGKVSFTACVTNNLSISKNDFYSIGQMQDVAGDGPAWWGDVDFGYRAWQNGLEFRRSRKAICYHNDYSTRSLNSVCQRAYKVSKMVLVLEKKYPGIIDHLPMFRDMQPVAWGKDSPVLVVRKILRRISAAKWVEALMRILVDWFEDHRPVPVFLRQLYRWITGAYISRGYSQGLRESQVSDQ